jgi:hypothetical protein
LTVKKKKLTDKRRIIVRLGENVVAVFTGGISLVVVRYFATLISPPSSGHRSALFFRTSAF